MLAILNLVLPLFGVIFLGYIAGRILKLPLEGLEWLNIMIIYVMLPALIFKLVSITPVEELSDLSFVTATTFATLVAFCLTFFIAGMFNGGNVGESTIQGFAGAYGNIGYMGPPLAIAAFGPEAAAPVALIFCFDNSLHFTLAPLLMAFHGKSEVSFRQLIGEILAKIFTHPFILATIAAILVAIGGIELPNAFDSLIDILAAGAAPCALFAMGVTAALRPLKRVPLELTYILPMKQIVHPLLVFGLLMVLAPNTSPIWIHSAVLLATLPVATNVFVIAQQYGVWQERASSTVVISTFASIVTVTAFLYLIREGYFTF
ncbi:MAG: AEC family transporter [Pseudomonadota bacterium]